MIRTLDALQLAATKLKTRKIRLGVTVVITSLMFATLAFLAAFGQGVIGSLKDFGQEGYGGRYLVQATPLTYSIGNNDQEIIDHFKPIQADLVAKKKAAAKKLDIPYDENSDQTLPLTVIPGQQGGTYPNYGTPLVMKYINDKNDGISGSDYASFAKVSTSSGATSTYRGTQTNFMTQGQDSGTTTIVTNGNEELDQNDTSKNIGQNGPTGMQTLTTIGWSSIDSQLMQPFVLPKQTLATTSDGSVPTIAPMSVAEEILGLKALPQTATASEKLSRLTQLRAEVAGKTAQLCYRNGASSSLVSQAVQQQKDIAANKNNKDYVKPTLIYQLPSEACGPVTIKSDTRSADEKKQASNQLNFDTQFGNHSEPVQGIVTVRIVGLSPDISFGASINAMSILSSLFTSSMGGKWLSPNDAVTKNTLASTIQGSNVDTASRGSSAYYAEFPSLKSMEVFIKDQACDTTNIIMTPVGAQVVSQPGAADPVAQCIKQSKVFTVVPYGNSAGAIESFRSGIWKVTRIVLAIILVIASLIMMGNVGKIIADSRRETAVFRSLGAKRFDIGQIYLTYTLLISIAIALVAIIIGSAAAFVLDRHYTAQLSVNAVLTYNAQDTHKSFSLFGVNALYLAAILGLVFVAGLISASIPLLTNTRRNPIRDMRDDT